MKKIKIAIDGYSSCGKSTIAKEIAKKLGYIYVDTGAMYRAATLFFIRKGVSAEDPNLKNYLSELHIEFKSINGEDLPIVHLNGENVENEIRSLAISNQVSYYSKNKDLRQKLVHEQQEIGKNGGVVLDGRDIGSVVFPDAELKLFMTASPEIRAQRRFDELRSKGDLVDFEAILENVKSRDLEDSTRKESPLIQVEDAIVLDNSHMNRDEQLEFVMGLVQKKLN
ncbi:MAG: (d)CMP kinase [Crocinitomicaceae bacterium]|nr:(d)CMP kinase [Crocinitomicaceae bacterium]